MNARPLVKAIPTAYNGVNFRSRLEARWAAFFDIVGWAWEYEPLDLDGWCPDFLLYGKYFNTLVEVKPVTWIDGRLSYDQFSKAIRHDRGNSVLLLGVGPLADQTYGAFIGMCNEIGSESMFDVATMQGEVTGPCAFGFCSLSQGYTDRISGNYPGGSSGGDGSIVMNAWRQAGNHVQWRPY